jgi:hypothetical protein
MTSTEDSQVVGFGFGTLAEEPFRIVDRKGFGPAFLRSLDQSQMPHPPARQQHPRRIRELDFDVLLYDNQSGH